MGAQKGKEEKEEERETEMGRLGRRRGESTLP